MTPTNPADAVIDRISKRLDAARDASRTEAIIAEAIARLASQLAKDANAGLDAQVRDGGLASSFEAACRVASGGSEDPASTDMVAVVALLLRASIDRTVRYLFDNVQTHVSEGQRCIGEARAYAAELELRKNTIPSPAIDVEVGEFNG